MHAVQTIEEITYNPQNEAFQKSKTKRSDS